MVMGFGMIGSIGFGRCRLVVALRWRILRIGELLRVCAWGRDGIVLCIMVYIEEALAPERHLIRLMLVATSSSAGLSPHYQGQGW